MKAVGDYAGNDYFIFSSDRKPRKVPKSGDAQPQVSLKANFDRDQDCEKRPGGKNDRLQEREVAGATGDKDDKWQERLATRTTGNENDTCPRPWYRRRRSLVSVMRLSNTSRSEMAEDRALPLDGVGELGDSVMGPRASRSLRAMSEIQPH